MQNPTYYTVDPQDRFVLSGPPEAADPPRYVVGEYNRSAQVLEDAEDRPEMPEEYQNIIVYRSLKRYGRRQHAQEMIDEGEEKSAELQIQLEQTQLPRIGFAKPLA